MAFAVPKQANHATLAICVIFFIFAVIAALSVNQLTQLYINVAIDALVDLANQLEGIDLFPRLLDLLLLHKGVLLPTIFRSQNF